MCCRRSAAKRETSKLTRRGYLEPRFSTVGKRIDIMRHVLLASMIIAFLGVQHPVCSDDKNKDSQNAGVFGLKKRIAWTTSKVRGRPEPPLPFRAKRVFPKLAFKNPTVLTSAPGTDRLFVAEQAGKVFSIPNDPECETPDLLVDAKVLVEELNKRLPKADRVKMGSVYGLTFHPDFANNRQCFLCYVVGYQTPNGRNPHPNGTRVVRLTVSKPGSSKPESKNKPESKKTKPESKKTAPSVDVTSEVEIISWLEGGHNGGCIKFGKDGNLFVSTGDGGFAFPPDGRNSGQDVSNLLSAVLRIDVDHPTNGKAYSIPTDNPFVALKNARPEIWAYGMRNPWKMSVDRSTGDLWVGDVGWELWELVYRVKPGDNYGWSLFEGRQPVHSERKRGPTPIVPPAVEIPHTDGASITGGFVYRGSQFPELQGKYIFGDWETRRMWGVNADGDQIGPRVELVEPTVRIVGYAERNDGELLLLDYDAGSIHELVRNNDQETTTPFPTRLSQTGLFDDVANHKQAAGVVPFSINVAQWADHATGERLLAIPGDDSIVVHHDASRVAGSMFRRSMDFPKNTVLAKTLSLQLTHGDPQSSRRIETQLLHFNGYDWRGYSYRWDDDQKDAQLVESQGLTTTIEVIDSTAPEGKRLQQWKFPSRMECIRCHNPWAEFTLAFNIPQLNRDHQYAQGSTNQLRAFKRAEILTETELAKKTPNAISVLNPEYAPRLTDPKARDTDINLRARSYLHTNCAHCHRSNGGGAAKIHVPFDTSIHETKALGERPTQGSFGLHNAQILAASDPYRSIMYLRMAKVGPGHMPRLGSSIVDQQGVVLIHDWIQQLSSHPLAAQLDQLAALDEDRALIKERKRLPIDRQKLALGIAQKNKRERPNDQDFKTADEQLSNTSIAETKKRTAQRKNLVGEILKSPEGALLLADKLHRKKLDKKTRDLVLSQVANLDSLIARDLFEAFLPDSQKVKRLGDSIDAKALLALKGNINRGRDLFQKAPGMQCRNCHKVKNIGISIGPDLTQIGKKLTRAKLLESILEPSKTIDPKFVTWIVETKSGKVFTGLLVKQTDDEFVIRDSKNKEHRFKTESLDGTFPQQKSLMPDLLAKDMTAQQVADLLDWLVSLK
jgi:uncharacterized repeat protein (TIGR03806 family)